MGRLLFRWYRRSLIAYSLPFVLAEYFSGRTGAEYGVGLLRKLRLMATMIRNRSKIPTASHFLEHLTMATRILNVPKATEGCLVECGSYKGGSAANLSLVAALCGRRLVVCDSFEGLPDPEEWDRDHRLIARQEIHQYAKGSWRGGLEEVRGNIARCGDIDACDFRVGYFEDTLPHFSSPCVFVFADVDLVGSLRTCLKHLWPLLPDGCAFFTHEAAHLEISAVFFDAAFWRDEIGTSLPGLIGAGTGVGLVALQGGSFTSSLAYAVKNPRLGTFRESPETGIASA